MEATIIAAKVKEIIGKITGIPPETITNSAAFVDELGLDSLAVLEIAIDVENTFKVRASDEEMQKIKSVDDSVAFILQHKAAEAATVASA